MKAKEKINKTDISSKNPVVQRLMAFLEGKGKPATIAKKIGVSDNVFSNMVNRNSEPSVAVLRGLVDEFPELDVNYILTGKSSLRERELEQELKRKEEDAAYHKAIVNRLVLPGKTKGVSNHLLVDREFGATDLAKSFLSRRIFGRRMN